MNANFTVNLFKIISEKKDQFKVFVDLFLFHDLHLDSILVKNYANCVLLETKIKRKPSYS